MGDRFGFGGWLKLQLPSVARKQLLWMIVMYDCTMAASCHAIVKGCNSYRPMAMPFFLDGFASVPALAISALYGWRRLAQEQNGFRV